MATGSLIIVTHNSGPHIEACLQALRDSAGWERIVIDNHSSDETAQRASSADPGARVIVNQQNLGFAAAANSGARIASGRVLLFLNPDAVAQRGALDQLSDRLAAEGVGAAGGALIQADGEPDRGFSVRRLPTPAMMMAEILLLNRLWPHNRLNRAYRCLDLDYRVIQEVEQPAGACLAVRREAWESIGGFDERFFPIWFEDVDLCRRLRSRGWKILYCPRARFVHTGAHSINQLSFRDRQLFWYQNLLRYFRKHHSRGTVALLRVGIATGLGLRSVATLFGSRPKDVSLAEALLSYADLAWKYALLG